MTLQVVEGRKSEYPDTGCELSPTCLDCTQPVCRYDLPAVSARQPRNEARDKELVRLKATHTANALAKRFNLSRRQVFRILSS